MKHGSPTQNDVEQLAQEQEKNHRSVGCMIINAHLERLKQHIEAIENGLCVVLQEMDELAVKISQQQKFIETSGNLARAILKEDE